nr:glycosyltransferase family 4 protein [Ammoniphilus resinae]
MSTEFEPYIIGGLGTVATGLAKALKKLKVKVKVITKGRSKSTASTKKKGIKIVRIPMNKRYYKQARASYRPKKTLQLINRLFPNKPHVLHVHSPEFAGTAVLFNKKHHIPILYTCHSLVSMEGSKHHKWSTLQALLFRHADKIVVPSTWLKKQIKKRFPSAASKILVIPNGVQVVSKGTKVPSHNLLFVGRLIKNKGIEPLIHSISKLSKKNKRVHLNIIGGGSQKYRKRLKKMAKKDGVSSKLSWLGALPHKKVLKLYNRNGAVVVPSKQESFCLVALEALANGIPLVSTRAGGLKEFVNERNAQIIKAVKAKEIAQAIKKMWENPQKTRKRIKQGKLTANKYNWKIIAKKYKNVISRLS